MKRIPIFASIGLFAWACFSNVFIFEKGDSSFLIGFVCLLFGWSEPSWYANLALIAAWIFSFKRKHGVAAACSAVALLLGLTALLIDEVPRDMGGESTRILGFYRGYYLWMSAHLVMLVSSILFQATAAKTIKRDGSTEPDPAGESKG